MKQLLKYMLVLILLAGIALAPAFSQEQGKKGPHPPQKETERQDMGGMKEGMMSNSMMSMMSSQNEMMGKMLDTMREMAQTTKDQAKDPDAKAKADQMLTRIDQMKARHQEMMGMMSGQGGSK